MRGKPQLPPTKFEEDGITPADAGKTRTDDGSPTQAQDHPRGCGENGNKFLYSGIYVGSPPRMRGKPEQAAVVRISTRITPADAGKTGVVRYPTNTT